MVFVLLWHLFSQLWVYYSICLLAQIKTRVELAKVLKAHLDQYHETRDRLGYSCQWCIASYQTKSYFEFHTPSLPQILRLSLLLIQGTTKVQSHQKIVSLKKNIFVSFNKPSGAGSKKRELHLRNTKLLD